MNNYEQKNEEVVSEEQFIFDLKEFKEAFEKFLKAIQNETIFIKDNNSPKQTDYKSD